MEEISTTSPQPTPNESFTDANEHREVLLDKPSDDQNRSAVGPEDDIAVPQRGRKPKRKVPEPQQKGTNQEKNIAPVRPVRRKDSLTPERKQKPDALSAKLLTEDLPVQSLRKVSMGETVPTQPADAPSLSISKEESSIPLSITQNGHDHESVGAQLPSSKSEHAQEGQGESAQRPVNVTPPPRIKRRDGSLPPETPQKTAPCKPLRKKDTATREKITNDQQDLKSQVSSALETSDPDLGGERSSDISGGLEFLQNIEEPSKTTIEMIPSQTEETKQQSLERDFVGITPLQTKSAVQAHSELEDLKKDINTSEQFTSPLIPPLETKEIENIVPKTEPETAPLSIIKKIRLPKRIKVPSSKISSSQNSENPPEITDSKKDKQTTLPVPRPRVKKRFSGSFPDDFTATEKTCQEVPSSVSPTTEESKDPSLVTQPCTSTEEVAVVRLRRSRLPIEYSGQVQDGGTSQKTPEPSGLPVPKPRVKKRLSDSFPDDTVIATDVTGHETIQQSEQSSLPLPMPRPKKRLSATYSDGTPPVDSLLSVEIESSQRTSEDTSVTSKDTKEGTVSLDSSVISEGGFVAIQGENVASEVEDEVLAAMQEDHFPRPTSVEATEKAEDEIIEGWTFTDKPVVSDDSEKVTETIPNQEYIEKVLGAEVDECLASTVASSQEDWLHVEDDKESEPVEITSKREMRDEELDFGFVSVDVAAGCLEDER